MFESLKLTKLDDYFKSLESRQIKGIYFYRIVDYSDEIKEFIIKYFDEVKKNGVFIKEGIKNPDQNQLSYFTEMAGLDFKMDPHFFEQILMTWLPRLNANQRISLAESIYDILYQIKINKKNDNIVKNSYIKFMCWIYYKFERILINIGTEKIPKILFEGTVTTYEIDMFRILAKTGCDIVLLQYNGDNEYLKIDPGSAFSNKVQNQKPEKFPSGFSVLDIQNKIQNPIKVEIPKRAENHHKVEIKVEAETPGIIVSTNTWISGEIFLDSLRDIKSRGVNSEYYYNMFIRITGVEDKANYLKDLLQWKLDLEKQKRKVLIINSRIEPAMVDEVQKINRNNYKTEAELIMDISKNLNFSADREIEKLIKKVFIDIMQEQREKEDATLNKLTSRAVNLICLFNRYKEGLFSNFDKNKIPTFIFYGVCSNENEAMFIKLLSRLPVDVFLINPYINKSCILQDKFLFDKKYSDTIDADKFPDKIDSVKFGTVAYNAEQDLNTILYQDTGVYRNKQFKKAIPVNLNTTYEEIALLWDQESKFRPNFQTLEDRVMVPVLFSKVNGVPDGKIDAYWSSISNLIANDTYLITKLPYIKPTDYNQIKQHSTEFLKNGKLQIQKIKSHSSYQYGFLSEDIQDYIFDKLQQLINKKLINGTLVNGTEYTIVSVALNLDKEILRMVQKYDFAKKIPKLIIVSTGEEVCSLEDSIFCAFLNTLGFDIAIFTPTGYQSVERNFSQKLLIEHQIGEYLYDLRVPNLKSASIGSLKVSLKDKLFGKGR